MSSKSNAAESIRRLAVQYQQMVEAADLLDSIGSLEQAAAEAKKAAEAARADTAAARAEADKAKAEAKKSKEKVDKILSDADGEALAKVQEAEIKAQGIVADAKAKAEQITNKAAVDVADATAGVAGRVAELTTMRLRLEQELAALQNDIDAKKAEADDVEKRLAKAQAQVAKLLG